MLARKNQGHISKTNKAVCKKHHTYSKQQCDYQMPLVTDPLPAHR